MWYIFHKNNYIPHSIHIYFSVSARNLVYVLLYPSENASSVLCTIDNSDLIAFRKLTKKIINYQNRPAGDH